MILLDVDDFVINHVGKVLETVEFDFFMMMVNVMWVSAGTARA
jgi:hypothetical protein